ncbi:MAG: Crp/Fnr family transcriptional regulator [Muricauda sp.]|nr:Crp/Fnr family transcriptional regulator [Allomuricauda sp.]MAU26405.1 Crp/Fnr family transcriptional regulator [Allomuricauda sp.]MBC29513.1 Crp/Fnr family transcriptional regulator [Allomuricauda sp.]|tara:strand:- start:28 stop:660 length:633 start_codon:yes stop_codon:yes gene_type:complete
MQTALKNSFGDYFEPALLDEIAKEGIYKEIKASEKIMEIGEYIKSMPLLISGAIKVLREDNEGDELLLYYLEKGDTCSMTMACCMGDAKSEVRAIAETDVEVIMVPVRKMEEWMAKYRSWRNFVFDSYHNRLNELLLTVDTIAFMKMDERLVAYLAEKARINQSKVVKNTHQEIAYDLHSSRVVISRLLKRLEKLGKVKLHRNHIEIIDL